MTGNDIDLLARRLPLQGLGRALGNHAVAQLLGHRWHVRHGQIPFLSDLSVRPIEAHEGQAQHPDPQGRMMSGQGGPRQIIEAGPTRRASVPLARPLPVIVTIARDRTTLTMETMGTAPRRPANDADESIRNTWRRR